MPRQDMAVADVLGRAISLLDEALESKSGGFNPSHQLLVWRSAAEAEYAAFRISVVHGLADYNVIITAPDPPGTQDELAEARSLLRGARSASDSEPRTSYEMLRKAVGLLRKLYVSLESVQQGEQVSIPKNE